MERWPVPFTHTSEGEGEKQSYAIQTTQPQEKPKGKSPMLQITNNPNLTEVRGCATL